MQSKIVEKEKQRLADSTVDVMMRMTLHMHQVTFLLHVFLSFM
jgi:hypothetical protein